MREDKSYAHNAVHLNLLGELDGRSVETLRTDEYALKDIRGVPVEFLKEALGFGNVRTLILSRGAARPCLLALNEDPGASGNSRWFLSINTLTVHLGSHRYGLYYDSAFLSLLNIASKRKVVGFPFKSVSVFLCGELQWSEDLEKLRSCVEKLEVVSGDDGLDWDVDKYFLDGLEHLQKNRDAQWD